MCAIGAGMSTASSGPRPCTPAIKVAFQLSPRLRVQHRLGDTGRAGGEQDQRHVGGPAGARRRSDRARPRGRRPARRGRRSRRAASSTTSAGSICPRAAATSAAPKEWRTGAATAPMRQQARVSTAAARLLGTCQATASPGRDATLPEPARDRGHQRVGLGGREPGVPVDHLAAVGGDQRVERRDVPGSSGPAVAAGQARHPGRSEAGRHGRAPYPDPSRVTPMSASSTEPAWTSR